LYAHAVNSTCSCTHCFRTMSQLRRALELARNCNKLLVPRRMLSYPNEPLTQAIDLPMLREPGLQSGAVPSHSSETHITRLENGLRVASQEAFGQYSTIGGKLIRGGKRQSKCALIGVFCSVCGCGTALRGELYQRSEPLPTQACVSGNQVQYRLLHCT